jgi:divalent metal cation (Fe/Co/Zn/Cd) transporter
MDAKLASMLEGPTSSRAALVRRGLWLDYGTIAYNTLEAVVSLVAGLIAGSVALVGFGVDSLIEVTASGAAQWRLRVDLHAARRERVERTTLAIIGWSFLALAMVPIIVKEGREGIRGNDSCAESG